MSVERSWGSEEGWLLERSEGQLWARGTAVCMSRHTHANVCAHIGTNVCVSIVGKDERAGMCPRGDWTLGPISPGRVPTRSTYQALC